MDAHGPGLEALLAAIPSVRLLAGSASTPVAWVHSSDLADPTPFLEPGTMLLTTGTQFADDGSIRPWVERVSAAGVAAIGFGTEVVRTTPPELVAVCTATGTPLVEVAYRTPFIALIRHVADAHAARARERDTWSLAAQRAISVASLGNGGVDNVLRTLAVRLDGTVVLFGGDGAVQRQYALRNVAPDRLDVLADDARRLLARGGRAGGSAHDGEGFSAVHTIGRTAATRAVIGMIAPGPDDSAARAVITSAVAIAEVTLDRDAEVARVGSGLGTRAVGLLRAGRLDAARAVADAAGRPLPAAPVIAVASDPAGVVRHALDRAGLLVDTDGDRTVAVMGESEVDSLGATASATAVAIGTSAPIGLDAATDLARSVEAAIAQASIALEQAERAAESGGRGPGSVVRFRPEPDAVGIVLGAALGDGARLLARDVLGALPDQALTEAAVWLEENGQWEPAARRLGLHRHVLRRRVESLSVDIGIDIDAFGGRAELWALLVAHGRVSVR